MTLFQRMKEYDLARASGFTEAEASCWVTLADFANKLFALPTLHKMDNQEMCQAIHVLQDKLLARVAYARYLKACGEEERSYRDG